MTGDTNHQDLSIGVVGAGTMARGSSSPLANTYSSAHTALSAFFDSSVPDGRAPA